MAAAQPKPWPTDGTLPDFAADLVDPLDAAARFMYRIERVNQNRDVPYTGMELPDWAGPMSADRRLSVDGLDRQASMHGHDALRSLMAMAVQTGIAFGEARLRTDHTHGGEGARAEREVSAAVEEAAIELGLTEDQQLDLEFKVRRKLENPDTTDLMARHKQRVDESLARVDRELAELKQSDPAEYERQMTARRELIDYVLGERDTPPS